MLRSEYQARKEQKVMIATTPAPAPAKRTQGSHWIRPVKRLAIYLRDGLACVYCSSTIEETMLTLDHIIPYSQHGTNDASNLVTACGRCNKSRGPRSLSDFLITVAAYLNHSTTPATLQTHINACLSRPLDLKIASELMSRRSK